MKRHLIVTVETLQWIGVLHRFDGRWVARRPHSHVTILGVSPFKLLGTLLLLFLPRFNVSSSGYWIVSCMSLHPTTLIYKELNIHQISIRDNFCILFHWIFLLLCNGKNIISVYVIMQNWKLFLTVLQGLLTRQRKYNYFTTFLIFVSYLFLPLVLSESIPLK